MRTYKFEVIITEGEDIYDYISQSQFENGKCIWYSIFAYGAYAYNVEYEG
jgi:hypothetical protein